MEPVAKRPKITDHFRVALKPHDSNVKNWPSLKNPLRGNQNAGNTSDHKSNGNDGTKQSKHQNNSLQQQLKLQPKPLQPQPLPPSQQQQPKQQHQHQHNRSKENIEVITINDDADESITQTIGNKLKIHDASLSIDDSSISINDSKISIGSSSKKRFLTRKTRGDKFSTKRLTIKRLKPNQYFPPPGLVPPIVDHDADLLDNVWNEPHYAWDSFEYDKIQEKKSRTRKYLNDETNTSIATNLQQATMATTSTAQPQDREHHHITPRIRARLVDWLVDIQNDFRLDHEPLYLAVKIADQYLMRKPVMKSDLELLYMTSIFISVKFDYRPNYLTISELIQEFTGRYERKQVVNFELDILSTLDFNIRYPLSYGFLRRFARCTSSHIQTLTLARYILESSLLEYDMIDNLESKMAAACLLLSNRMLNVEQEWGETAEFYTGYNQQELDSLVAQLNRMISKPPDRKLSAVRRKYSNEVFMSVANIEPLNDT